MHIVLLHNPKAGRGIRPDADDLLRAIRDKGHTTTYQSTKEKGAKWTLLEPADLVIAAGGDGTVRKAAMGLAGRKIPLAVLPLGTANNLARALGINASALEIIHSLDTFEKVRLNVGVATGPWGKTPFIESAGAGLLARTMSHLSKTPSGGSAPSTARGSEELKKFLQSYRAAAWTVDIDGRRFSETFLLVEAMNLRFAGPNLPLAAKSDPGDGLCDVVFVREADRNAFENFLDAPERPPSFETIRAGSLHLGFPGPQPIHVDDFTWPPEEEQEKTGGAPISLDIGLTGESIEVLVPRARDHLKAS